MNGKKILAFCVVGIVTLAIRADVGKADTAAYVAHKLSSPVAATVYFQHEPSLHELVNLMV